MTAAELETLLERASEAGARKALASVGLHDDGAAMDVRDLRGLLDAWREMRRAAVRSIGTAITTILLGLLVAGAAVKIWRD